MVELINTDCLEHMQSMETDSVDLVFTSPPYEAARTYGIDFDLKGQEFVDWCRDRYMECVRVCKGLVAWVIEGQTRSFQYSAAPALLMADLHRAGVRLRKPPIYHRVGIPGSGGPDWLRNDWEWIICSSKGKLPWSENTAMGHTPKYAPGGEMSYTLTNGTRRNQWGAIGSDKGSGSKDKHGNVKGTSRPSHKTMTIDRRGSRDNGEYDPPAIANPGNVIHCKVGGGHMGDDIAHENEAPFPESLVEFFVRSFCPPGGIVLDPFCGSGTTIKVAKRFKRNAIGIDIRKSQIELTRRRITEVQAELFVGD